MIRLAAGQAVLLEPGAELGRGSPSPIRRSTSSFRTWVAMPTIGASTPRSSTKLHAIQTSMLILRESGVSINLSKRCDAAVPTK